jgi:hypothetical protein
LRNSIIVFSFLSPFQKALQKWESGLPNTRRAPPRVQGKAAVQFTEILPVIAALPRPQAPHGALGPVPGARSALLCLAR